MAEVKALTPVLDWWRGAGRNQRLAVIACVALCLIVGLTVAGLANRPSYTTLFSGLQEKDASDIVAKLQESKVPYRLVGEGTVQVPQDRVHELRLQMAGLGLPRGGSVGFEIFDQTRLGQSEFQEKLNYRRALQGELERTISSLAPIEQARVHIALPERRLFAEEQEKPTASVILRLRPGGSLDQGEVTAIQNLVAASVEGLARENVTVVDAMGTLLSGGGADPEGMDPTMATRLRTQYQVERQIEKDLQSVLDRTLGVGKAVVRVSADLDFSERQTQEETYTPESEGHGVLESQHENTETYTGGGLAGGVVGLSSNRGVPVMRPAGGGSYERRETQNTYRVSKRVETRTETPGQIKRLSVAVFVDERVGIAQADMLQQAVMAAAGIDEARGDRVVVQRIPFSRPAPEPKEPLLARLLDAYRGYGQWLVALAMLGCFLLLAKGMMRSRPAGIELNGRPDQALGAGQPQLSLTSDSPAAPAGPDPGNETYADLLPTRAAEVVRAWLLEEENA